MPQLAVLLAYYESREDGQRALNAITRTGFSRSALAYRDGDEPARVVHPARRAQRAVGISGGLALAAAAFLLARAVAPELSPFPKIVVAAAATGLGFALGVAAGYLGLRWLRPRATVELVDRFARMLAPDEQVVVTQAGLSALHRLTSGLHDVPGASPSLFLTLPERTLQPLMEVTRAPLALPQIQRHAERLARESPVHDRPPKIELLNRLDRLRKEIHVICGDLGEIARLEGSVGPTVEWILDNEYVVEGHVRDVQVNLSKRFYRSLPSLAVGPFAGLPRVYAMARELIQHTDLVVDQRSIGAFLQAFQSVEALTIGELWAFPQMLRIALVEGVHSMAVQASAGVRERQRAAYWAHRLRVTSRREPSQLFSTMALLAEDQPDPSFLFSAQLTGHLYDEEAALVPVQIWLERTLRRSLREIQEREQSRQASKQLSIGNAISSLRQLALLDWRQIFERHSTVETELRRDPANLYPEMDFETRNRYRETVEVLSRASGLTEVEVAAEAIALARRAAQRSGASGSGAHVGSYLQVEGRAELARRLGCSEPFDYRLRHWVYQHHTSMYLSAVLLQTAALVAMGWLVGLRDLRLPLQLILGFLLSVPASQIGVELTNYWITRLLPPRTLPKMDFQKKGIPDSFRTLVTVPVIAESVQSLEEDIQQLEIRYLANPEANLVFSLFLDYVDAPELEMEQDAWLLAAAKQAIERLNQKHGGDRFMLFHRRRTWAECEGAYIGWERKRGKLEEINRLICGLEPISEGPLVVVGDAARMVDFRFVITLDRDTQLPRDTARRMVETLAHPLNQPQFGPDGEIVGGYMIIQPRVSTSLPSASATPFSRLFTNPVGIDPYSRAVSDAYQDLTGEGSYHGKGIYDPRAFQQVLGGRFPEQTLLSHDLIEGAHARVALASDIELFDDFPSNYRTYARREHRWIRGDWQIAPWLFPRVPQGSDSSPENPLSIFNRWKIFDNLRRSLVPPSASGLLVLSWFTDPGLSWFALIVVAAVLLFQPLATQFTWATTRRSAPSASLQQIQREILRALAKASLLPYEAGLVLDAILRTLWRLYISRKHLLQWTTSQLAGVASTESASAILVFLSSIALLSLGLAAFLVQSQAESLWAAAPWLSLWVLSPVTGWLLQREPGLRRTAEPLDPSEIRYLRRVARRTWRFFDEFVTESSAWLPPDNFQVSHQNQLAPRTSPTNIGMWLLSALAAHDLGYLTPPDLVRRLRQSFQTIHRLERYRGHLLNWYGLPNLKPLSPKYVSFVDSGNFVASLWTLAQGLQDLRREPLLSSAAVTGVYDSVDLLRDSLPEHEARDLQLRGAAFQIHPGDPHLDLTGMFRALRYLRAQLRKINAGLDESSPGEAEYWAQRALDHTESWLRFSEQTLGWLEMLAHQVEGNPAEYEGVLEAVRRDVAEPPGLADVASGAVDSVRSLEALQAAGGGSDWVGEVLEQYASSQSFAIDLLGQLEALEAECSRAEQEIEFRFLYDPVRRLFAVGYNVDERRLDRAYYDMLASEARLGSFIAIARGEVPVDHWFSMSRPYGSRAGGRVLMSWTGTMFEYLMPHLLQRTYPNTLLEKAVAEAIDLQIDYARSRGVPWGISESAYGDLDFNRTYQYRAFGVPWLGLKRGLDEDLVVAPYATMLALPFVPKEGIENLRRLEEIGLADGYGFFEAIDYNLRDPNREGRGVFVRAYMAHHQGMSFLGLTNLIEESVMQARFHRDLRVQAVEPLLYERIPASPVLHHLPTREELPPPAGIDSLPASVSEFSTPHTITPRIQLLSNGRLHSMVTAAGGGYTRWKDLDVTRWRSDTTRDHWGSFLYLRDLDTDRVWSNTYHPVAAEPSEYKVRFPLDRAEFQRRDRGIQVETEVIISPEDDVEIRRIGLANRSLRMRHIELSSYIELALAEHGADRQHPAFNKLFIETEAARGGEVLLAKRRHWDPSDPELVAGHRLTFADPDQSATAYETDRARFIGRGRSLTDPEAVHRELSQSSGFVLDPIFSLRSAVRLLPGQSMDVSLILAVGETRQACLQLLDKYSDPAQIDRAFDLSRASTQLALRMLKIQPDEARRFQKLGSFMLYPSMLLRPPVYRIRENRKGQSGLWPYGISGDYPLAMVSISEAKDLGLVRQLLQAHSYWHRHGLHADLVIVNEEASGYERPLNERLEQMVQVYGVYADAAEGPGIHLVSADQLPAEDLTLLQSVARVSLVAARGPLSQQLGTPSELPDVPPPLEGQGKSDELPAALPYMELPYFNGLGGFTADGREYVIYLGPDSNTPAPWVNVIANPSFGTLVSESGASFTWFGNSQRNRLTAWSNDPVIDPTPEAMYLRDEITGEVWSPTPAPIRDRHAYRCRHGAGSSSFEHSGHGVDSELTIFVPIDEQGGEPLKLSLLRIHNDTDRRRRLSLTYYVEWTLGEHREETQQHIVTRWENESGILFARNRYHPDYGDRIAFLSLSPRATSYTGDRTTFLGRNGSPSAPQAMSAVRLARRSGAGYDPCGALQTQLELEPRETVYLIGMLGETEDEDTARELVGRYQERLAVEAALSHSKEWWHQTLGTLQVETPEMSANLMLNRWLRYQSLSCRMWARSAFYQSGGAFGYRDQLQDSLAWILTWPDLTREQILEAARHQFEAGDVQHWWHPPSDAGIRSRSSDDLLWLPYATATYVQMTGDVDILDERIPFMEGPELEPDQYEVFLQPTVGDEGATLFEHCQRAVERGLTAGPNGLPLIGTGDWNDGMNRVGAGGQGESGWLAWFLVDVLRGMAELSTRAGVQEAARGYLERAESLLETIEREAWDGAWYLRATFDSGMPLGSSRNTECWIDSLPQSWAWIAGGGDPERAESALESAWRHLVQLDNRLVLLFTPPFDQIEPSPGYIRGYPPGVRENGGQYTHAALWLAMALARSRDGGRAVELLRLLNPIEHARDMMGAERYKTEPYAVAADVYRLASRLGRGGWSWYTGSAAWMYRVWIEEVLGLKARGDHFYLDPTIPETWSGFKIRYRYEQAVYWIEVVNPEAVSHGVALTKLDGRTLPDGRIPLDSRPIKHQVMVRMGNPGQS